MPTGFFATLSVIWFTGPHDGTWSIIILGALTYSFSHVATVTTDLQREVRELREQLAELQDKPK